MLGSRGALLFLLAIVMLGMITSFAFSVSRVKTGDAGQALEAAQKAGSVTDTVSALVFLEKYRASHQPSMTKVFGPMILGMLAPMGAFVALFWGLPLLYSSYNFYWGDYVGVFNKRRAAARVLWTVVVLGLLVSVLGGLLLKYFFG